MLKKKLPNQNYYYVYTYKAEKISNKMLFFATYKLGTVEIRRGLDSNRSHLALRD